MTKQEHLLTVAMEECAEIQQSISKALRFGLPENERDIIEEYYQLQGVFNLLFNNHILHKPDLKEQVDIIGEKMVRVREHMYVSEERGCIKGGTALIEDEDGHFRGDINIWDGGINNQ